MRNTVALSMLLLLLACGQERPAGVSSVISSDARPRVLLLGMPGCAKTEIATRVLAGLAADREFGATVERLDVPPPGGTLEPVSNWPHDYPYALDENREMADRLDFFYYPTLYVLDAEGEVRYSGGCDAAEVRRMVAEIAAEEPGGGKKVYTRPVLKVGTTAPEVRGKGPDGQSVEVSSGKPTLLLFTSIGCPYSSEAAETLFDLELDFEEEAVIAAIEKGRTSPAVRDFYSKLELAGPVVCDADGAVSKAYGVEPVPFFFVMSADGTIAARAPYTESAARAALERALGREPTVEGESSGAG